MPSPFPGMDPYLEAHWEDVHHSLITYIRDALQPLLAEDLIARSEERVYVDVDSSDRIRQRKPDVRVVELPYQYESETAPTGVAVADRPVLLQMGFDPVHEGFVLIVDADGNRIVTAIEVISPDNKGHGEGRRAYLRNRDEFLASDANLVEIDLIRDGDWVTMLTPYHVPQPYRKTYRVSVRRADPATKGELYSVSLRERLPRISVPLRAGEQDVVLDVQLLIDMVYRNGRYNRIDYSKPCDPPLTGEDDAWADELLRASGRR